jgi:7,8-dihydropterin-6-yl-methyl-4-(beta-D-ribofuranosyl)aminobenzene 5'-phosphate synthase
MVTPARTVSPTPAPVGTVRDVVVTIVYDNEAHDSAPDAALRTRWGFACWIETPEATVLFDTGGDGPTLLANMAQLGKDPQDIDLVVLSHEHGDHVGGLQGLIDAGAAPIVYVPASFSTSFRRSYRDGVDLVDVSTGRELVSGVWTTGEVAGSVNEQGLVVAVDEGWLLITGCAHPGVATMAEHARAETGGPLLLALGGFHLGDAAPATISRTIERLRALDVAAVAPTHCTGRRARAMFADAYGDRFRAAGLGAVLRFPSGESARESQIP